MSKVLSSKGVLEEVIFRAYVDLIGKRYRASQQNINIFSREIASLHSNTTITDIPSDFRNDINGISHSLIAFINAQGFTIVPKSS